MVTKLRSYGYMYVCRPALSSLVYFLCNLLVEQKDIKGILIPVRLPRAGSELYWLLPAQKSQPGQHESPVRRNKSQSGPQITSQVQEVGSNIGSSAVHPSSVIRVVLSRAPTGRSISIHDPNGPQVRMNGSGWIRMDSDR